MKASHIGLTAVVAASVALLVPTPASGAATNTVALWNMNENPGARVLIDSSGNGLNGTIGDDVVVGATFNGAKGHRFTNVKPNQPPANPERIDQVPHNTKLNPGTRDFAVTIRFRTTHNFGNLVQKGQSGAPGGYFKFEAPKGVVTCLFRSPTNSKVVSTKRKVNDGQWHTLRCERTSSGLTMSVDGVITDRRNGPTGNIANTRPISIAGKLNCNQRDITCDYFAGDIDYIKIEAG